MAIIGMRVPRTLIVLLAIMALLAGCGSSVASSSSGERPDPLELPLYVLAGPDATSLSVWRLTSRGAHVYLKAAQRDYGIDGLAVDGKLLVLADAASGSDVLAVYNGARVSTLSAGYAQNPIYSNGSLYYVKPLRSGRFCIYRQFGLSGAPATVYCQGGRIGGLGLSNNGSVEFLDNPHLPGPGGPQGVERVVTANRKVQIKLPFVDPGAFYESRSSIGLAATSYGGQAVVKLVDGSIRRLPRGWLSVGWSASGRQLFVESRGKLAVWAPLSTAAPRVLAKFGAGTVITEAVNGPS